MPDERNARPDAATLSPAATWGDACEVTIQVKDAQGADYTRPTVLDVWLSDSDDGSGLARVEPSDHVHTECGADLDMVVHRKCLRVLTDAKGRYILRINDNARAAFVVACSFDGRTFTSRRLTDADYGHPCQQRTACPSA